MRARYPMQKCPPSRTSRTSPVGSWIFDSSGILDHITSACSGSAGVLHVTLLPGCAHFLVLLSCIVFHSSYISSCIDRLTSAHAGIDNIHMTRCCSVIPRPLVRSPLVSDFASELARSGGQLIVLPTHAYFV